MLILPPARVANLHFSAAEKKTAFTVSAVQTERDRGGRRKENEETVKLYLHHKTSSEHQVTDIFVLINMDQMILCKGNWVFRSDQ